MVFLMLFLHFQDERDSYTCQSSHLIQAFLTDPKKLFHQKSFLHCPRRSDCHFLGSLLLFLSVCKLISILFSNTCQAIYSYASLCVYHSYAKVFILIHPSLRLLIHTLCGFMQVAAFTLYFLIVHELPVICFIQPLDCHLF